MIGLSGKRNENSIQKLFVRTFLKQKTNAACRCLDNSCQFDGNVFHFGSMKKKHFFHEIRYYSQIIYTKIT